jgi:gamma-tubulin complex component 4
LEQDILRGVTPALPAALESALSDFSLLLPSTWAVIEPVAEGDGIKGAALLRHLRLAALAAGAPRLETALRMLEARASRAAFQQLLAWTVHGRLVDPHGEFWVIPARGGRGDGGVWLGDDTDAARVDSGTATGGVADFPSDPSSSSEDEDASPFLRASRSRGGGRSRRRPSDAGERDWHGGFQVSLERLPPGVELRVAESALFAGRAVRVLSNPKGRFKAAGGAGAGSRLPAAVANDATRRIRAVAARDDAFDRSGFETAIESIRKPVADLLGRLVIVDAELPGHLGAAREYLLLGKGDFYREFLEEADSVLRAPPRASTAEADLLVPFQAAAAKSSAADDRMHSRFRLRVSAPGAGESPPGKTRPGEVKVPSYDGWDCLSLEYAAPWPLGLILTRDALGRYDEMFRYLFRLRRAASALDAAWVTLRRVAGGGGREGRRGRSGGSPRTRDPEGFAAGVTPGVLAREACQRARRDIAFVVNNWLTYLQTDVVEARYSEMTRELSAMIAAGQPDFVAAQKMHRGFLAALRAQSFLDLPEVTDAVEQTLAMARRVCHAIETLPLDGSAPENDDVAAELQTLADAFSKVSRDLYDVLRSDRLADDPKAPYLRRLLLRLNFNEFVGKSGARGGGGVGPGVRKTNPSNVSSEAIGFSARVGKSDSARFQEEQPKPSARSAATSLESLSARRGWGAPEQFPTKTRM